MNIFEKSNTELASIYVVYESPVTQELPNEKGLSHMLEHMICDNLEDIELTYDQHALVTNAFTGDGEVVFYLQGLSSELNQFKDEFIKRITTYTPKMEHFLKQKPIILQEYDDAYADSTDEFVMNYYSLEHGYVGPIGVRKAIEEATFETITNLHSRVFNKPTKIILIDKESSVEFSDFRKPESSNITKVSHFSTEAVPSASSVTLIATTPLFPFEESYAATMIGLMLSYSLPSPLYQELREKNGLCYQISAGRRKVHDQAAFIVSTSVKEENIAAAVAAIEKVLKDPNSMSRERFDTILGNRKINRKIHEQALATNGFAKFLDSSRRSVDLYKNLDSLTYEDVMTFWDKNVNPANVPWSNVNELAFKKSVGVVAAEPIDESQPPKTLELTPLSQIDIYSQLDMYLQLQDDLVDPEIWPSMVALLKGSDKVEEDDTTGEE